MTPLEFEKKDSRWEYEFQSGGGGTVIQVLRAERGAFTIYARIADVEAPFVPIYNEPSVGNRKDIICTIDVPAGLDVKITSWTEVTAAYAESTT